MYIVNRYTGVYKCRACGKVWEGSNEFPVEEVANIIEAIEDGAEVAGTISHHRCAANMVGIGDLICFKVKVIKEETNEKPKKRGRKSKNAKTGTKTDVQEVKRAD